MWEEFPSEDMATMKKAITTVALLVLLSMTALAATGRYDQQIQQAVSNKIHDAKQLQNVQASVEDGIVTLTGDTYNDVARDSALAIVQRTPGVKDVVNEVKVLPTSIFDNEIRVRTARAIYRDSVLGRYAIDPVDPIRIVVDNGHVTLYGTVQSQMDKNIAGLRASGVFGAFSVDNKLAVN